MPATAPPQPTAACVYKGYVVVCSAEEMRLRVRQYSIDPEQSALFRLVGTSEQQLPRPATTASATTHVSCRPFDDALLLIVYRPPAVDHAAAAAVVPALTFRWSLDGRITSSAEASEARSCFAAMCTADCVAWFERPTRLLRARTSNGRTYCAALQTTRVDDVVCGCRPLIADRFAAAAVVVRSADRLVCLALLASPSSAARGGDDDLAVEATIEKYEFECVLQDIVVGSGGELIVSLSDGRAVVASAAYGVSPRGHLLDLSDGGGRRSAATAGAPPLPPSLLLLEPERARSVCDVAKLGNDARTHAILYADRTVHVVAGGTIKVTYTSVQHFLAGDLLHRGFDLMLLVWNDALESATVPEYLLTDFHVVHKQRRASQCDTIKSKGHSMAADALKARLQAAKRSESKLQSVELQLERLISVFCRSRDDGLISEPFGLHDLIRQSSSAEADATSDGPPSAFHDSPHSAALALSVQSVDWFVHENLIIFAINCLSERKPSVAVECDSIDELQHDSSIEGSLPGGRSAALLRFWSIVTKVSLPTFLASTMNFRLVVFSEVRGDSGSCAGRSTAVCTDVTVHAVDLAKPERRLVTTDGASQRLPATCSQQRQTAWDLVQSRQHYAMVSDSADLIHRQLRFLGFVPGEIWWTNGSACAFNGMRCRLSLGSMEVHAKDQLQHSIFRQVMGHLATPQVRSSVIHSDGRSPKQLLESLTTAVNDLCSSTDEATQRALPASHKRLQKPKRQPLQAASTTSRTKADATGSSSVVDCLRLVEATLITNAAVASSGAEN